MKKILFLFAVCSIMAQACTKKDTQFQGITGSWKLVDMQGGLSPREFPPSSPETLILSSSTFQLRTKDSVVNGSYSIVEDTNVIAEVCLVPPPGEYTQRIIFTGAYSDQKIFFQLDGTELKTLSGCFALDGGVYKKYVLVGPPVINDLSFQN